MVWRSGLAVFGVVLLSAATCNQEPTWQQPTTTEKPQSHVEINFDDTTITPEVARVKAGGTVSWVSLATQYRGSVVLPPGVRQDLSCAVRPDFMEIGGDKLQSIPLGMDNDDVDLPCPLKKGTYDYQVYLEGAGGLGADEQNPEITMKGRIIVE